MAEHRFKSAGFNDQRLSRLMELASRLEHTLNNRIEVTAALTAEVTSALTVSDVFDLKVSSPSAATQLDKHGCALWNAALRVDHNQLDLVQSKQSEQFTALLKALSFALLCAASSSDVGKHESNDAKPRLFKVALKAAQSVLVSDGPDLALRMLEMCSSHAEKVEAQAQSLHSDDPNGMHVIQHNLVQTYLLLRIQHAKAVNNADLAEHFVQKLDIQQIKRSTELSERASELFHDYGLALAATGQQEAARRWLMRALDTINACKDLHFQQQTQDLRIAVTSKLVHELIGLHDERAQEVAWMLASEISSKHGIVHLAATVLELNVLMAAIPMRRDLLGQTAMRLTSNPTTKESFNIIFRAILKMREHDPDCAEQTLKRLIQSVLHMSSEASEEDLDHIETSLVTYTYFITKDNKSHQDHGAPLLTLYDDIYSQLMKPFNPAATHAIQTLLWRAMAAVPTESVPAWIGLLQHKLLSSCSDANKARIDRKATLTFLTLSDLQAARRKFFEMPSTQQNEPLTLYLAYKTALRSDDFTWASESLRKIATNSSSNRAILYACALEAQQTSKHALAIETLQALVDSTPAKATTPTLLRCLARLMLSNINTQALPNDVELSRISNLFERFLSCSEDQREISHDWESECKWWSKNAYNLGLSYAKSSNLQHTIRMLRVAARILDNMLTTQGFSEHDDVRNRLLICHFVMASTLITSARHGRGLVEEVLQHYSDARQEISKYFVVKDRISAPAFDSESLKTRAFQLRRYELEAIIKLKQWHDLETTIAHCLASDTTKHWDKFADLALIIHKELSTQASINHSSHAPDVLEVLQRSINEMWKHDKNIAQVARWLRTTLSIDMEINRGLDSNKQVSLKLLDQAAALASRGAQGLTDRYPDDELQWLVSTTFNRGVDFCVGGKDKIAWQFFDAALELARHANDNGALHACIMARRAEANSKMLQRDV